MANKKVVDVKFVCPGILSCNCKFVPNCPIKYTLSGKIKDIQKGDQVKITITRVVKK